MIVLDTNYVSLFQQPEDVRAAGLRERLLASPDKDIVTSGYHTRGANARLAGAIHGQARCARTSEILRAACRIVPLLCRLAHLPFDDVAADRFQSLRAQRIRIGTMDLKIASIVLVQDATLLSSNLRDFRQVPGLRVEHWL